MNRTAALVMASTLFMAGLPRFAEAQEFKIPPHLVKREGVPWSKLSSGLVQEFERQSGAKGSGLEQRNPLLKMSQDLVLIDAVASGDPELLRIDLENLGGQKLAVFRSTVSGWIPVEALNDVGALASLQLVRPAVMHTNVGSVTSQGDASMRADDMRTAFGVDGSGVTIGTLSDSYDALGGAAADVASGDLPSGIVVVSEAAGTDEGRAMMQLIADVAPGASQAFHTGSGGVADFALGIQELAGCPLGSEPGCTPVAGLAADVIVDDITYLTQPMLQDGIVAQSVDLVKSAGVAYFSSAGNANRQSYETPSGFVPSSTLGPSLQGLLHDFDPGAGEDPFQSITIPIGTGIILSFQWDSPFFSVSGAPGSPNDLDIYITGSGVGMFTLIIGSFSDNIGGDAVELLGFFNDGSLDIDGVAGPDTEFNIVIENFTGPDPGFMKYIDFGGETTFNEYFTSSSTLFGHPNAEGAEAVGAAFYGATPEFGTTPPALEPSSSAGSTPILFNTAGTPVFEVRAKPEIVGPDGTNTTFFGSDIEPDGFPNFFGTSAAGSHAAALAALLLEADPTLTPDGIYNSLETFAIDISTPGFDFDSGFGLIQGPTTCLLDAFEPDGTSGQASALSAGVPQVHGICPVGEEDWSTFVLPSDSHVELETSGAAGDTSICLHDSGVSEIECDAFIDRTCNVDPLAAGTYFVQVHESEDDDEIAGYTLNLSVVPCGCPSNLVLADQTLTGTQTLQATMTATLGPNLTVDGDSIVVNAPSVDILGATSVNGPFSIGTTTTCP